MMTMKTWNVMAIALLGSALGVMGCEPHYDRTTFTATKADALGGGLTMEHLDVHEGLILTSQIRSYNDDDEQMSLRVRSANPAILEVKHTVTKDQYAFVGKAVGRTQLEIIADDRVVLSIEADVHAQPTP